MNVIAFRLPNASESYIYECAGVDYNFEFRPGHHGYVVKPFHPSSLLFFYEFIKPLPAIPSGCIKDNDTSSEFRILDKSEYGNYIDNIKASLNGNLDKKIVASRRHRVCHVTNPQKLFETLCARYPDAFVFFISVEEFGTWIGASPELLLQREGVKLMTMSLAGTRKAGDTSEWSDKNLKEQRIVTDFIRTTFGNIGLKCREGELCTKRAGAIEHLMTTIQAESLPATDIRELLSLLSPTPALSGFPKEYAIDMITRHEGDRKLYGGFAGPIFADGNFILNVLLRCAHLSPYNSTLFAGGGITALSDPEEEWEETENKFATLKNFF